MFKIINVMVGVCTIIILMFHKVFVRGKIDYRSIVCDAAADNSKLKIGLIQNSDDVLSVIVSSSR